MNNIIFVNFQLQQYKLGRTVPASGDDGKPKENGPQEEKATTDGPHPTIIKVFAYHVFFFCKLPQSVHQPV